MKVAVLGCGAIGSLILGYLSKQGRNVLGIVRDYQKEPLLNDGLNIEGVCGSHNIEVRVDTKLKETVDLAIFATKIDDIKEAIRDNYEFLNDSVVLSTQNGIQADYILNEFFGKEKIISGIVMFGATFYGPNKVVHNFKGDFILGNVYNTRVETLDKTKELLGLSFNVSSLENIKGAKYLKLFINLNNCLPAILGISLQEAFGDLELAKLAIQLNKEAYKALTKSNTELASLPSYPKERISGLVNMPINEAARLFSKIMTNLSKEPLYGSILQSIKRGKKSEIDYINGEIVNLAGVAKIDAPLNRRIVELVHKVEDEGKFLFKQELLSEAKGVVSYEEL